MRIYLILFFFVLTTLIFAQGLEVQGEIKIGSSSIENPTPGTIRWTGSDFEGWNGVIWISLTGNAEVGNVQDADGHVYRTIRIGSQEWMTDNLRTTKYNDSTDIDFVEDGINWSNLTTGAWCIYDTIGSGFTTFEVEKFGRLYNWFAVDSQKLCQVNWRVATDAEWTTLTDYLGGALLAGGKMKEPGTMHWMSPNNKATNESGFTGLPGGYRNTNGDYLNISKQGFWWSSTLISSSSAFYRFLIHNDGLAYNGSFDKRLGYSIRCLKN